MYSMYSTQNHDIFNLKLNWFEYVVKIMVPTSVNIVVPIWICTAVLEHIVLHSIVYRQLQWIRLIIVVMETVLEIRVSRHPVTHMTHCWCHKNDAERRQSVKKDWALPGQECRVTVEVRVVGYG